MCVCVHHAYPLPVNGNPGNLLRPPSGTIHDPSPICGVCPSIPVCSSPPVLLCHQNQLGAQLQPQSLHLFVTIMYTHYYIINLHIIHLFCRRPAACVFFCYQMYHLLIEQYSGTKYFQCNSKMLEVCSLSRLVYNSSTSQTADIAVKTSASWLFPLT